jgi:nicotinate phosphoribosyltransferase
MNIYSGIDYYSLNSMLLLAMHNKLIDKSVVFELFCRKLPYDCGVVAGMNHALARISSLSFNDEEMKKLVRSGIVDDEKLKKWLLAFKFSGEVIGMSDGSCFRENEPVAIVVAKYGEAILLENIFLSSLSQASSVASKALELRLLLKDELLIEMGSRRNLPEQSLLNAYASYLAGFNGSSNIDASAKYGIPFYGTIAHSYVQLYNKEEEAFISQMQYSPAQRKIFLLDTFDVEAALEKVIRLSKERNVKIDAFRIDSGDNELLDRVKRRLYQELEYDVKLMLTGDVDLERVRSIKKGIVDAYGIGGYLAHGGASAVLPFVYKLTAVEENGRYMSRTKRSLGKSYYGGVKILQRDTIRGESLLTCIAKTPGEKLEERILAKEDNSHNPLKAMIKSGRLLYEGVEDNIDKIRSYHREQYELYKASSKQRVKQLSSL